MKKKILAITGIRSEYDIFFPVLDKLRNQPDFEVKVVVSGAHLSDWHGLTLNKVLSDGFVVADCIDNLLMTNRVVQRAKGAGLIVYSLAQTVEREQPDFLICIGDREESLAAAIVGNYMEVLTAHLCGGDPVYGNADDPVRFACSKLAHIHFPLADFYSDNLKKTGEEDFRIFTVGNPAYSNILNEEKMSIEAISAALNIPLENKKFMVFLKHPLSSELSQTYQQAIDSLSAAQKFSEQHNLQLICIHPNTDPGSYEIIKAINEFVSFSNVHFFQTLSRSLFINLMRHALALVGNSSMGILESPFYKLPVVNIGNRQKGRYNSGNIQFVDYNEKNLMEAFNKACFDKEYRDSIERMECVFGDGNAPDRVLNFLRGVDLNDRKWYVKQKLC